MEKPCQASEEHELDEDTKPASMAMSENNNNAKNLPDSSFGKLFTAKLYSMIENEALPEISWTNDGKAWKVHNRGALEKNLHEYFKHK